MKLRPPPAAGAFTWGSALAASESEIFVAPVSMAGMFHVFDFSGSFLRTLQPVGAGFGTPLMLSIGPGDSLHIVDNSNRRHSVMSTAGSVGRWATLPGLVRAFAVTELGRLVVETHSFDRQHFGVPVHLLSPDGTRARGFDAVREAILPQRPHNMMRALTVDAPGRLWAARVNRYELRRFDVEGQLFRTVVRDVEWFSPWLSEPEGTFTVAPPPPRVVGISGLGEERLAVFVLVPDLHWAPRPEAHDEPVTITSLNAQFDTIIEVIDHERGVVVGQLRHDWVLTPSAGSGLAYAVAESNGSDAEMFVWRIRH